MAGALAAPVDVLVGDACLSDPHADSVTTVDAAQTAMPTEEHTREKVTAVTLPSWATVAATRQLMRARQQFIDLRSLAGNQRLQQSDQCHGEAQGAMIASVCVVIGT
jgi:hypothetical protein